MLYFVFLHGCKIEFCSFVGDNMWWSSTTEIYRK